MRLRDLCTPRIVAVGRLLLAEMSGFDVQIRSQHGFGESLVVKPKVQRETRTSKVAMVAAQVHQGQKKYGVEKGSTAMRSAGLEDRLKDLGVDLMGWTTLETSETKSTSVLANSLKILSEQIRSITQSQFFPLTLGGDHSLAMGSILGHSQVHPDLCLLWVDAHADINTPAASRSGNLHGMPLSFLIHEMQEYLEKPPGFEWLKPCISKDRLAYIGLRDLDPFEWSILEKLNIKYFDMKSVDKFGISRVTEMALSAINPRGDRPIHVSFDIDSLDSELVPSTGTPVSGGLTLREGICIAEHVFETGQLAGLDMVEVNPEIGSPSDVKRTVNAAIDIISAFLGNGRSNNNNNNIYKDLPGL